MAEIGIVGEGYAGKSRSQRRVVHAYGEGAAQQRYGGCFVLSLDGGQEGRL